MGDKVNIYKMVVMVFDNQDQRLEDVIQQVENTRYLSTIVFDTEHRVIEDFHDDHPINKKATNKETFYKMFENERHEFIDSLSDIEFNELKYFGRVTFAY